MKKIATILSLVAVAAMFIISAPQQAEARPQYAKAFMAKYDIAEAKELKCGVCHGKGGMDKKTVSDYGKALGKALGMKNQKDEAAIGTALDEAAKADAGDGKTFGDLLKDGKLPPAAE